MNMYGETSIISDFLLGTVQGSILGLVLIWNSCECLQMTTLYQDSTAPVVDVKESIDSSTKRLRNFGLFVNRSKTEICTFYRTNIRQFTIIIGDISFKTKNEINILGVLFDTWLC